MNKIFFATAVAIWLTCSVAPAQSVSKIKVENIALKSVEIDGMFGKTERFRYFFRITNSGPDAFGGSIEIGLHNIGVKDEVTKETFEVEIAPAAGKVVQIDSPTGPRKYHGDFSINGFVYSIDGSDKATGVTLSDVGGIK